MSTVPPRMSLRARAAPAISWFMASPMADMPNSPRISSSGSSMPWVISLTISTTCSVGRTNTLWPMTAPDISMLTTTERGAR